MTMNLSRLQSVYEDAGPFATVYLEGRSPGEDVDTQTRLRWQGLRERLADAGAGHAPLEAIEATLEQVESGTEQTNGRVLVASDHGVVLDQPWDAALGSGDEVQWGALPELGALVREECRSVRMLVAIAKHQAAQIRQEVVAEQHVARDVATETVTGSSQRDAHKPRGGALAHKQIQRRAEQALRRDIEEIVAELRRVAASFRPRLLVLAGEVQERTALRDALPEELSRIYVDAERGDDQDEAAEQALAEQVRDLAEQESTRNAHARAEQLNAGLAHGQAVHGSEAVAQAAEMGAVETLLFEHNAAAAREAELLKMCAQTSAHADLVVTGTDLAEGVGALLRFPLPS